MSGITVSRWLTRGAVPLLDDVVDQGREAFVVREAARGHLERGLQDPGPPRVLGASGDFAPGGCRGRAQNDGRAGQ